MIGEIFVDMWKTSGGNVEKYVESVENLRNFQYSSYIYPSV